MKNILRFSLAWGQSPSALIKDFPQRALPAQPPPPRPHCPYLPPRRPRGAWAPAWAASLLCCGAPSSAKEREHVRSRELPVVLGYCFTTLQAKVIFHPKKTCRAAAQGPSPAVSMIRGKLTRCQVLRSSRKEKGPVFLLYFQLHFSIQSVYCYFTPVEQMVGPVLLPGPS